MQLKHHFKLPDDFVLLPSGGSLGSYKNPDVVASALCDPCLTNISLVISGIDSHKLAASLLSRFPLLTNRVFPVGTNDYGLASLYRHALAVVVPSLYEGFGLTVIEAIASGGIPIVSYSPGLLESLSGASFYFHPNSPSQLVDLIRLLSHSSTRSYFFNFLSAKSKSRLSLLSYEIFGLALLAQARLASNSSRSQSSACRL